MNWQDWEKALLALAMWREARGEGREGMRAVGHVILNRARLDLNKLGDVITARNQFSSISVHGDGQTTVWPSQFDEDFGTAMLLAATIMGGEDVDPTSGATFYWNPATAADQSGWFRENVATNAHYIMSARIGHHDFYKLAV